MISNLNEIRETAKNNYKAVYESLGIVIPRNGMIRCPIHNEKTPSCKVYEDGSIYCFSCQYHADIIKFVQDIKGTDFKGAVRFIADLFSIKTECSGKQVENPQMDEFYLDSLFQFEGELLSRVFDTPAVPIKRSVYELKKEKYNPFYTYTNERVEGYADGEPIIIEEELSDPSLFEDIKYQKGYRENISKILKTIALTKKQEFGEDDLFLKRLSDIFSKPVFDEVFYNDYLKWSKLNKKPTLNKKFLENALQRWEAG